MLKRSSESSKRSWFHKVCIINHYLLGTFVKKPCKYRYIPMWSGPYAYGLKYSYGPEHNYRYTEHMRSPYTEHAASGLPNPADLGGELRFVQAQDQQVTTDSPRIVTECLLNQCWLKCMYEGWRAYEVSVHQACCERATHPCWLGRGSTICPGSRPAGYHT